MIRLLVRRIESSATKHPDIRIIKLDLAPYPIPLRTLENFAAMLSTA